MKGGGLKKKRQQALSLRGGGVQTGTMTGNRRPLGAVEWRGGETGGVKKRKNFRESLPQSGLNLKFNPSKSL